MAAQTGPSVSVGHLDVGLQNAMSVQVSIYWTVHCGDELVATIVPGPHRYEYPWPWQSGSFTPAVGYDAVRDVLAEESRYHWEDVDDHGYPGNSRFWKELKRRNIRLQRHPDGETFTTFDLHIDGALAWWRT